MKPTHPLTQKNDKSSQNQIQILYSLSKLREKDPIIKSKQYQKFNITIRLRRKHERLR